MQKIQKMSSYCWWILNGLLIVIPLLNLSYWFSLPTASDTLAHLFSYIFSNIVYTPTENIYLNNLTWTPALRLLGLSAHLLGLLPYLWSLGILKAIFKNYQAGEIFSAHNALLYQRLGALFFLDALITKPLSLTLMILTITLNNPPGHRYLTLGFGVPNLASLFYGTLIIIVSWVMLEAHKISEEQKFTV